MIDWLKHFYAVPLRLLVFAIDIFTANRDRLKALMSRPGLARGFRALVVITALLWLLIFLFADDQHGERLNQAFKEMRQTSRPPAAPADPPAAPADPPAAADEPGQ